MNNFTDEFIIFGCDLTNPLHEEIHKLNGVVVSRDVASE